MRCAMTGNLCSPETSNGCTCTTCGQWRWAFSEGRDAARLAAPGSLRPLMGLTVSNPGVQGPLMEALDKVKGCGPSREFSLVRTKIEEALLWLKAAERGDAF